MIPTLYINTPYPNNLNAKVVWENKTKKNIYILISILNTRKDKLQTY